MDRQSILLACDASIREHGYLALDDDLLRQIGPDDVTAIREAYGPAFLMKLPDREVRFFDWLKAEDRAVWDDLWGSVETAPYLISLAFLDRFTGEGAHGDYLICDLQTQDNYFFTPLMFHEKESRDYVAAVQERFKDQRSLTAAQALALEASVGEVDIWHFAYRNRLSVEKAKQSVQELVADRILVHVTKAEHLTEYFDVR